MTLNQARRDNLSFLIQIHGSQTALANKLNSERLTQQVLSAIQRGARALHSYEAREIEQTLGIPALWMDHDLWVKKGWRYCKTYCHLDSATRLIVDEVAQFVLNQSNQ